MAFPMLCSCLTSCHIACALQVEVMQKLEGTSVLPHVSQAVSDIEHPELGRGFVCRPCGRHLSGDDDPALIAQVRGSTLGRLAACTFGWSKHALGMSGCRPALCQAILDIATAIVFMGSMGIVHCDVSAGAHAAPAS